MTTAAASPSKPSQSPSSSLIETLLQQTSRLQMKLETSLSTTNVLISRASALKTRLHSPATPSSTPTSSASSAAAGTAAGTPVTTGQKLVFSSPTPSPAEEKEKEKEREKEREREREREARAVEVARQAADGSQARLEAAEREHAERLAAEKQRQLALDRDLTLASAELAEARASVARAVERADEAEAALSVERVSHLAERQALEEEIRELKAVQKHALEFQQSMPHAPATSAAAAAAAAAARPPAEEGTEEVEALRAENEALRAGQRELEEGIDELMEKYRVQIGLLLSQKEESEEAFNALLASERRECEQLRARVAALQVRVLEMTDVMRKAAGLEEGEEDDEKDDGLVSQLLVENEGLREMLRIAGVVLEEKDLQFFAPGQPIRSQSQGQQQQQAQMQQQPQPNFIATGRTRIID